MSEKDVKKLVEVMTDVLAEIHHMRNDFNSRFESMDNRFESIDSRLVNLEKNQKKTNKILSEHSRSLMRMADELGRVPQHEIRIQRLENTIFDEDAPSVGEPKRKYKRKKGGKKDK